MVFMLQQSMLLVEEVTETQDGVQKAQIAKLP